MGAGLDTEPTARGGPGKNPTVDNRFEGRQFRSHHDAYVFLKIHEAVGNFHLVFFQQ